MATGVGVVLAAATCSHDTVAEELSKGWALDDADGPGVGAALRARSVTNRA